MRLLFFLFCLFPTMLMAQEVKVQGTIKNPKKVPVQHVNVFIPGTYDGTMSDSLGNFQFKSSAFGKQKITFSKVGYTQLEMEVELKDSLNLQVTLYPIEEIEAIEIRAGQIMVGNKYNAVLSPLDIVTTAGSMGNIVAALQKLPGAQIAGEDGRLMVRGGDPTETQTFVNGIQVFQPYTSSANGVPVRGRFSPFLFKGTNFSTGGYGAEFGNALSGILNLSTALELAEPKTELSFSTVGLGLSNTQSWKDNSLSINGSYTNLKPYTSLIPQDITWGRPYQQASGEAIWRKKGKQSFLNLYGNYAFEDFQFEDYSIEYDERIKTGIRSHNAYLNSSYQQYLPNNWTWESGLGLGYFKLDLQFSSFGIPTEQWGSHVKTLMRKSMGNKWQWMFGTEFLFEKLKENLQEPSLPRYSYGYERKQLAAFSEGQYRLFAGLQVGAGLRYIQTFSEQQFLEPRASIGYAINRNHQASFAYGRYHQGATSAIAKFKNDLPWTSASHYVLNYSYIGKGQLLRLEAYSKDYDQLITYDTQIPQYQSRFENKGFGRVKGIDVFWRDGKSIPFLQYWVSYSLTDARKLERNFTHAVQPTYVAKHQLSLVAKYWISSWRSQASITNTYSSGRTYFNPNEPDRMPLTKGQNDLSVSWSYLLTQQKILFFSMTNVLGNEPIYGYQYRSQADANGQFARKAVVPTAKHFVFVGFFWTISKNKKDNQLENL